MGWESAVACESVDDVAGAERRGFLEVFEGFVVEGRLALPMVKEE